MTRVVDLRLGRCELRCPLCGDGHGDPADIARALATRPDRVVLRGAASALADALQRVRALGVGEVVVRTHALEAMTPERARAFAARGAHAALVPLFSSASAVHDRIVNVPGALASSLAGMRALADAGLAVEVEVPLLSPRLQSLEALVSLAHRAVPSLRAARFYVPDHAPPPPLATPAWSELREGLVGAVRRCRALGVEVRFTGAEAIPLCALRDAPELWDVYRFQPRRPARRAPGWSLAPICSGCAARAQCPGLSPRALAAHGDAGLSLFAKRPPLMYAQRTPGAPAFTAEHRRLAAKVGMLVLRPTVHCNQDCTFCSANETSGNVWERPDAMLRALARAARRGVRRVSFGGGEPTLSRDLVHYVKAASRLGVEVIELVTNAVLLDREARVAALRAAGLTHAFVSLHAHDEALSQSLTRKVGDHARTVRGVQHLLAAGVDTALNHVVTARNAPHLTRFVEFAREAFGGRCLVSIAFVTPQYKALEDLSQVPRLTDVAPHLRRALYRAMELGQPVQVGSRQGVPPCLLGEFRAWSDVLGYAGEPAAEDAPQKVRAPGCDACRYTRVCTGVWRPYAERYGTDELTPLPGAPFTDDERRDLEAHARARPHGWPVPLSFDEVHPLLRERDRELPPGAWRDLTAPSPAHARRALPVLARAHGRPLRALMVGAGRRARALALEARAVPGLAFEAVVSPHAHQSLAAEFGGCPGFASLDEALDALRPEVLVLASPTAAHHRLARAAVAAGIPCLVERPLTRTLAEADDLADAAGVFPACAALYAPGLDGFLAARPLSSLTLTRRLPAAHPDAPRAWSRDAIASALHDAIALALYAAGGGRPRVRVTLVVGERAPERIRLQLAWDAAEAAVEIDFTARAEETSLAHGAATWRRVGASTGDAARMLAHFRDVARGEAAPLLTAADARDHLAATLDALDALDAAGAPFARPAAPRHARSPALG